MLTVKSVTDTKLFAEHGRGLALSFSNFSFPDLQFKGCVHKELIYFKKGG